MGRPAQPLAMAKLKGATKKNPQRFREALKAEKAAEKAAAEGESVSTVEDIGPMPDTLMNVRARAAWDEIIEMVPPGILKKSDRLLVEIAANMLGEYRRSPEKYAVSKVPHLLKCLASMGLTPADRRKLALPEGGGDTNPFAALMASMAPKPNA